jgi:SAM-dependent methyltransferase
MTKARLGTSAGTLSDDFLAEYSTAQSIRKYSKETAGSGICYLLDHDYGEIYREILAMYVPTERKNSGIRMWEFGCGAGMNLLHLVSLIGDAGFALDFAIGTDFSDKLIEAASMEARASLAPRQRERVRFCLARNESLISDATKSRGLTRESLLRSFDLIIGVNTIRYCHRLGNERLCTSNIFDLLRTGGVCIVIDMNRGFPAFRGRLRDRLTKEKKAYYLPSLEEYARPFASAGFEILRKENFCWIPHSASPGLTSVMGALTPLLSALAPNRAMRSLLVCRKPGQ